MKFNTAIQCVWIDLVAHEKLWCWTRMAKGEVSMLGLVEETPEGPAITDLFLMKQTCTAASTDMDQSDVARLLFDLSATGTEGNLRAWVHSHADMATFWSKTDEDCIEGLAGNPYVVSLVVNKKGDVKARVDVFGAVRFTIDELPVKLRVPDLGLEGQCRAEFVAKVDEAPTFAFGTDRLGGQPFSLFAPRNDRPFAMLDLDEMEEAVRRGEMSVQEYIEATEGDAFMDPFVDRCETREVNDGRRA